MYVFKGSVMGEDKSLIFVTVEEQLLIFVFIFVGAYLSIQRYKIF